MPGEDVKIAIVGAGQAGSSLAAALRAQGFAGAVTLIGEEPVAPYQRPPLSKKYLLGELTAERLLLRPEQFYADQGITLRTGVEVERIDRAAKTLALTSGETLPYDMLALTTGSVARRLPERLGGSLGRVFTVRTLADVDAMAPFVREGGRVLVVGGGYIGLEAAAVAALRGMTVTLVEAAERILQRVAARETADFFRALHRGHGVDIREGVGLVRLDGDDAGDVAAAELTDGTRLSIDMAVVGIGIDPATRLAEAAGLTIENGIAVDALGRTSDPAIFAAGDCASFPFQGRRVRLESVPNAIEHAEATAASMLGGTVPYVAHPWFWSDQYDVKLQIAGLHHGYDRTLVRAGQRSGTQSVWYFCGDRLVAVDAMSDARAYMTGRRWIEAGLSPAADAIADAAIDLKSIEATPISAAH